METLLDRSGRKRLEAARLIVGCLRDTYHMTIAISRLERVLYW